jgi:hypothetical protein
VADEFGGRASAGAFSANQLKANTAIYISPVHPSVILTIIKVAPFATP